MFYIPRILLVIVICFTQILHAQTYKDSWFIYDKLPEGAKIVNSNTSFNEVNKTVKLIGNIRHNGYGYTFPSNIRQYTNIQCSLKYNEEFTIYISLVTDKGSRYITYTSEEKSRGLIGTYIYIGLGKKSIEGGWYNLNRNLSSDLQYYDSDNKIISVNAFLIRGSGIVENPTLFSQQKINDNSADEEDNSSDEEDNSSDKFIINVFKSNKNQDTFEVMLNNKKLRIAHPEESFYIRKGSSKVNVSYEIIKKENGVNINYTIHNNTDTPQRLPYFKIQGLKLGLPNKLWSTNLKNHTGRLNQRNINEKFFKISKRFVAGRYPSGYSPIIIAKNDSFTVGASLNYSILKQPHSIYMDLYYSEDGPFAQTYRITFTGMDEESNDSKKYMLAPNTTFHYSIPLRFSNSGKWISTIKPYKDYFNSLYQSTQDILPRDTRPIYGIVFSSSPALGTIKSGNTRGYHRNRRIDKEGLTPSINELVKRMNLNGYKRSMLWSFSGCYHEQSKGLKNWSINYPPQFISSLLPKVENTLYALEELKDNNLDLGFWWGHAGKVPSENQWNPNSLTLIDTNNSTHIQFGLNELQTTLNQGTNEIGLDAFGELSSKERLKWISILKENAPNIRFTAEGGKTAVDYMHAQVGIFIHPVKIPTGPNILANYINPNAEIQVYFTDYRPRIQPTFQNIQNLINWGLTPLLNERVANSINIKSLKFNLE